MCRKRLNLIWEIVGKIMKHKDFNSENDIEMLHEQLSAMADGELNPDELDSLLQKLDQLPDKQRETAMQKWMFFNNLTASEMSLSSDLSQSIQKAIQDEADPQHSGNDIEPRLKLVGTSSVAHQKGQKEGQNKASKQPVWAQWAVAASVCFCVVFGWQMLNQPGLNSTHSGGVASLPVSHSVGSSEVASSASFAAEGVQTVSTASSGARSVKVGLQSVPVVDVSKVDVSKIQSLQQDHQQNNDYLVELSLKHSGNARIEQPINGSFSLLKSVDPTNKEAPLEQSRKSLDNDAAGARSK